jgi:hypothetical protein
VVCCSYYEPLGTPKNRKVARPGACAVQQLIQHAHQQRAEGKECDFKNALTELAEMLLK